MWFVLLIMIISIVLGSVLEYIVQKILGNKNRKDQTKNDE